MTIFDLYLLKRFIKIFLICFASLSGLYIIIHAFTNLEEMMAMSSDSGSLAQVLMNYYGPRILDFFNQTAALIGLISAIFAFTILQRTHEITAIEAAGASKRRIVRPILISALILVASVAIFRETLIPQFREQLLMDAQDLTSENEIPIRQFRDHSTQLTIRSGQIILKDSEIREPRFFFQGDTPEENLNIVAPLAQFVDETDQRPKGYVVSGVEFPKQLEKRPSRFLDDRPLVLFPSDQEWLQADQCFVAMSVSPRQLVMGPEAARYAPLSELVSSNRHPSVHFSNRQRVEVHGRIVQPILDLTLILLGLPIVIARGDRNIFFATGICISVVIVMFLITMTLHGLGASRIISPPALSAWLPIMIFTPLAFVGINRLSK